MLSDCQARNPHLNLKLITDEAYRPYGRVLTGYDVQPLVEYMNAHTAIPDGCHYEPSIAEMEALPAAQAIQADFYGGLPAQFGYTNGKVTSMDALEWHRSSELVIACSDLVVLVGRVQDVRDTYDTSLVEAFYVPAGTAFELYATTLHYAPCCADAQGYRSVVVLPRDTNTPLAAPGIDPLLWAKNKWLIAHPSVESLAAEGADGRITGPNITVNV